jgi:hypothetical protein
MAVIHPGSWEFVVCPLIDDYPEGLLAPNPFSHQLKWGLRLKAATAAAYKLGKGGALDTPSAAA